MQNFKSSEADFLRYWWSKFLMPTDAHSTLSALELVGDSDGGRPYTVRGMASLLSLHRNDFLLLFVF